MFTQPPSRERIYLIMIGLSCALRFVNLGFLDLQAWDESLYTVRAEGILRFGNWIDQTSFSIDGLYSALHPPLHVWLTALSLFSLGINEFGARAVSACFGFATSFLLYFTGKKIDKAETGFYAALLFSLNPFVTFLARQGQFDTTMVFFITAAFYFLVPFEAKPGRREFIAAGVMVGLALMTKLFVGLGVVVALALWIAMSGEKQNQPWRRFFIVTGAAGAIALPWHLYMIFAHGGRNPMFFLTGSAVVQRALFGIEGNVKPLEIFYFVNQIIVLFPFGAAWFLYGLRQSFKTENSSWRLVSFWFLVFFVVFSLIRTKLAFYLLPALVPASLLAAREIASVSELSTKALAFLCSGTFASVLWSWDQSWRNHVKDLISSILRLQAPHVADLFFTSVLTVVVLLCTAIFILPVMKEKLRVFAPAIPYALLVPLVFFVVNEVAIKDRTQYRDGATQLSDFIREYDIKRIVVAGYERNPQLTYYLRGADIGWSDALSIRRISPPTDRTLFRQWIAQEMAGEQAEALLVLEKDKFIRYETIHPPDVVPESFQPVFESRRYSAYLRAPSNFLADSDQ